MSLGTIRLSPNMDTPTLVTALNQNFALLENLDIKNVFKAAKSGTVSLTTPACANLSSQSVSVTVQHNLSYIPLVIAFRTIPGSGPSSAVSFFFGKSTVDFGTISAGSISVVFTTSETVLTTATDITFTRTVANATGVGVGADNATIQWYALDITAKT